MVPNELCTSEDNLCYQDEEKGVKTSTYTEEQLYCILEILKKKKTFKLQGTLPEPIDLTVVSFRDSYIVDCTVLKALPKMF